MERCAKPGAKRDEGLWVDPLQRIELDEESQPGARERYDTQEAYGVNRSEYCDNDSYEGGKREEIQAGDEEACGHFHRLRIAGSAEGSSTTADPDLAESPLALCDP